MSRLALIAAALAVAGPAAAQARYSAEIEDLPLPPGLGSVVEARLFDSSGGRIVSVEGHGETSPAAVRAFYEAALPSLGWGLSPGAGDLMFVRGRQRLTLEIEPEGRGSRLRLQMVESPPPVD